jgi:hypothetical protein
MLPVRTTNATDVQDQELSGVTRTEARLSISHLLFIPIAASFKGDANDPGD